MFSRPLRAVAVSGLLAVLLGSAACSSPSRPSESVGAPQPTTPANNAQVSYYSQPLTLVVSNPTATGTAPAITFDVATDAAFASKVTSKTVAEGSGTTSATVDQLAAGKDYYWRATAASGAQSSTSAVFKFTIGAAASLDRPALVQPAADSLQHRRPTFTVRNATHSGPTGAITYRFDVATDSAFGAIVTTATVPEGANETSYTPSVDLTSGVTYYWRVRAVDASTGVSSDGSSSSFATIAPDDGNYRYDFRVALPPACDTGLTKPDQREWVFDDNLAVNGNSVHFGVPNGNLAIDVTRNGTQVSGLIGGSSPPAFGTSQTWFEIWRNLIGWVPPTTGIRTSTTGSTDNKGRLSGTFDGSIEWRTCCEEIEICTGRNFTWSLTPHQ